MTDPKKIIYFDNNATTAVAPEVFDAMRPYLTEFYGNPSSIHNFGGQVGFAVEAARAQMARLLGVKSVDSKGHHSEIIFTSCGTESDNAAIFSAVNFRRCAA